MDEKMKEAFKSIYDNLTDEQKEKAKACKNMDEMMALAGEWGVELPDELLDTVAGGGITDWFLGLWGCDDSSAGRNCNNSYCYD